MYHETTKNWGGSSEYDEQHKHKDAKEGEALNSNTIQKFLRWMIHIWGLVFTSNSYLQPCLENRHLTLRFRWFSLSLDTHSGLNLCIFLAVFVEKTGSLLVKRNRINHEQSKQTTRSNNVSNQPKKPMGFTDPPHWWLQGGGSTRRDTEVLVWPQRIPSMILLPKKTEKWILFLTQR